MEKVKRRSTFAEDRGIREALDKLSEYIRGVSEERNKCLKYRLERDKQSTSSGGTIKGELEKNG